MNAIGQKIKNDHILKRIAAALKTLLGSHLKSTFLFGSRARGDESPESDYDVMVIVDEKEIQMERLVDDLAGEIYCDEGIPISIFLVDEERFETEKFNPLFIRVRKEGVSV
jgi:predicted nucleotidyltransferase